VEDQVLLLAGCPLEDDSSLASCGISEHCTLEVAGRLLGGTRGNCLITPACTSRGPGHVYKVEVF